MAENTAGALPDQQKDLILTAVSDSTFGVTIADARLTDLPLVYVNAAFLEMTGYQSNEIVGRNCRFLQGAETDTAAVNRLRHAIADGQATTVLLRNYRKDQTPFWNRLQLSPIHNKAGELVAYMSIQIDVSQDVDYTTAERERQKMETLGQLAGGVAHELNNALQPIILMAELINDGLGEDRELLQGCVDSILEHANFAKDVVAGILSFARQEQTEVGVFKITPLIADVLKMAGDIVAPGISLAPRITPPCEDGNDPCIAVNHTEFTQVFMNLMKNAADAMGGAGVIGFDQAVVYLDEQTAEQKNLKSGRYVKIDVSDSGSGILEADLSRIFQPFYTTKQPGEGTGLGLSMVYAIVHSWGGTISVKSHKGSIFTVLIPILKNTNLTTASSAT